ncbi:MAG: YgiQ family radical SAM protein [Deltaproteobacteria bacterium]|nr:YgiQ family radical SAM protein [Deltaproteobacteria bacterium]
MINSIKKPLAATFLPMSRDEMNRLGWTDLDVLLITGDDYFDHHSHGTALIGRVLLNAGYRTGIICRPDWKNPDSLKIMGAPLLYVGISGGAVDSTLNNYTADLAPRKKDQYAAEGYTIARPNLATGVYCGLAKGTFPKTPVVLGGIEASSRRFAYYDYLKKSIRRSILVDTRVSILVFGQGEYQAVEIAKRAEANKPLNGIKGTALLKKSLDEIQKETFIELPDYKKIDGYPSKLITQTSMIEKEMGPFKERGFYQKYEEGFLVCEPPWIPDTKELDEIFSLPFSRNIHPAYKNRTIPAFETVKWSITSLRGCPGGCSFCSISAHQGRMVTSRSEESILKEVDKLIKHKAFKGTISDVGGPTANAYGIELKESERCAGCKRSSCFYPKICRNIKDGQDKYIELLSKIRKFEQVKHLFIASGIRHDLALKNHKFIEVLAKFYTGGHLKVAPEHSSNNVLKLMRKPAIEIMEEFETIFLEISKKQNKPQYLVPYFISGFPGCTKNDGDHAGNWLKKRNQSLEQVQNFIPLPGTMAAAMYAAEMDENKNSLYIPDAKERKRQKSLLVEKPGRTIYKHKKDFKKRHNG